MIPPYWNPTRRLLADGALKQLPEIAASFSPKKILFVLGQSSFRKSTAYSDLRAALSRFFLVEAEPVGPSPSVAFVQRLWEHYRGQSIDLVIGVGGGSVIDCAKAIRLLLGQQEGTLQDYVEKKREFNRPGPPLIAAPTTAGTGSEVTPYSSLQTDAHQKISLTHRWVFPEAAVIDPLLTHGLPPYVTACSGLDALSQSIEALWSVHHNPFSDTHAVRAVAEILENLPKVLRNPSDQGARFAMSLASTEGGLAITQTRTTAVHAVSYPLTTFFKIPHGHACALTLPAFIRYNVSALQPDRQRLLWKTMGVSSAEEAAQRVERLMDHAGLERSLRKMGLGPQGIDVVIENGFRSDRVGNNPRGVTKEDLRGILQAIY